MANKLLTLTDWHATALQRTTLSAHNAIDLADGLVKKLETLRTDKQWELFYKEFLTMSDNLGECN